MSQVNAEVVQAALSRMLEVAMDRDQMQSVRLSILKRHIVSLQNQIDSQKSGDPSLAPASDPDHHAERYSPDFLPESGDPS